MSDFVQVFDDRLQEIEAYLDLLDSLERQVQEGPPRIEGTGRTITVQQQRILYSSVYLQLYNLVESTITRCIDAVCTTIVEKGPWLPSDLSMNLRREWVRSIARTHVDLTYEHRLQHAADLCEHIVQSLPIGAFTVEKGGGGNWDDEEIYRICERLGLTLRISSQAVRSAKQPFRDDKGSLAFIKDLRNHLAHGTISFVECGENVTVQELRELKERTSLYLREVVTFFQTSIDSYEFLLPNRRPQSAGTST